MDHTINAAARLNGLNYNQFIHGLKLADVQVDRMVLPILRFTTPLRLLGWQRWRKHKLRKSPFCKDEEHFGRSTK
ncbi:MAG: 50S ribosomal protein L20 [Caldilineaceae bacterium]